MIIYCMYRHAQLVMISLSAIESQSTHAEQDLHGRTVCRSRAVCNCRMQDSAKALMSTPTGRTSTISLQWSRQDKNCDQKQIKIQI